MNLLKTMLASDGGGSVNRDEDHEVEQWKGCEIKSHSLSSVRIDSESEVCFCKEKVVQTTTNKAGFEATSFWCENDFQRAGVEPLNHLFSFRQGGVLVVKHMNNHISF